jgi:hypothetical protein
VGEEQKTQALRVMWLVDRIAIVGVTLSGDDGVTGQMTVRHVVKAQAGPRRRSENEFAVERFFVCVCHG